MSTPLESIYPRVPVWAQNLGISLYGLAWRRERLGGKFDKYVEGFRVRETWSAEKLNDYLEIELQKVLGRAFANAPYYARVWRALGLSEADFCHFQLSDLRRLPTTPKEDLRKTPDEFLSRAASKLQRLHRYYSSGTTGTPITAICTSDGHRRFTAAREARSFNWAGTSLHQPRSMIGGRQVVPKAVAQPPFHRYNWAEHQIYFSAYHISPVNTPDYVGALNRYRPRVLTGYASAHYLLARMMLEQGLSLKYKPDALVLGSEKLTVEMKTVLEQAFGARAYEEYGCVENCVLATECEHGRLHASPDFGILEIVDDKGCPVPPGVEGRLLCTSLLNEVQPLIRYEIGDLGVWSQEACPCGRNHFPVLKEITGRLEDVVTGPDGRQMVRFHGIFVNLPNVVAGQIVQEALDRFRVRIVTLDGFGKREAEVIRKRFEERLGKVEVRLERVPEIPRTEQGKFQAVISQVNRGKAAATDPRFSSHKPVGGSGTLLLKAFHALPAFARNWAASAHGYSLRAWRYSPATLRLTEEALEREHWSSAKWHAWLEERKLRALRRAALDVPYYRQIWEERRRRGDNASFEVLANWPILKKEPLRTHPELLVASDCNRRAMYEEHTSGTTGTPLTLWRSRETVQQWYALNEARVRIWNGLSHQNKWGHVGGQPVVPFNQRRPPYWVWNSALKQLYLSCMHIGPQSSAAYLSAIKEYGLDYLLGYASSIALLAQAALESGARVPLKLVVTDSEPLLQTQRDLIEKGFACPVRETYGMAEIACAASECSAGALHLWPEVGIIELLDENDQPVAPGQTGRIVATKLLNLDMPLIRYDTQDLAQLDPDDRLCACGRTLPRLRKVLGRNDDVVITADGRRIVQIDRIFDPCYDIREAQIIQEQIGQFTLKVVPGSRWTASQGKALCGALQNLVGQAEINLELVPRIERTWAGKYRIIISKVSSGGNKARSL